MGAWGEGEREGGTKKGVNKDIERKQGKICEYVTKGVKSESE